MSSPSTDVIIVGAGISGLSCALELQASGFDVMILESAPVVGGRLTTENIGDFKVDRGFQILLTAYPEVVRRLDLNALHIGYFKKGAHIFDGLDWHSFFDPRYHPASGLKSILNQSVFMPSDLWAFFKLWKSFSGKKKVEQLLSGSNATTSEALIKLGFSEKARRLFFTPFLGGVYLEPNLNTSERMFRFVMKMFINGQAALPKDGMARIPEQLVQKLKKSSVLLNTHVSHVDIDTGKVFTECGKSYSAEHTVIATNSHQSKKLISSENTDTPFNSARSFVFGCHQNDLTLKADNTLQLIAKKDSHIQVIAVPSQVADGYAPTGYEQIVVTLKDGTRPISSGIIIDELKQIYGDSVEKWELLTEHHIRHALPRQNCQDMERLPQYAKLSKRCWACGDYLETRSLNGALSSGRLLAKRIAKGTELKRHTK